MERPKLSSQISIDKKAKTHHEKSNKIQHEIDQLIELNLLEPIRLYDPKLNFRCVSIVEGDQILKQTRRQTYGLIWNSILSSSISQLIHEDCSCAFVEILRIPDEWSRYDTDLLLVKIRQKQFLNGLALRDEFFRVLQIIVKRNFQEGNQHSFELKDYEYNRNMIQLVFNQRSEIDLTIVVSLILLVEFDVPCREFFPEVYTKLCSHEDLSDYIKYEDDFRRTRLTPYNSIKFILDYQTTEAKLCEYLIQKSNPMIINFLKLRKEWLKYVSRASKYATETIKMQMHTEKQRQSTCSVNSGRSITSNASIMNKLMQNKVPLSTEIEVAFEYLFSVSIIRLLFLTVHSKYQKFGSEHDNDIAYAIEKALGLFGDALENNYLEHPFFPNMNILPESFFTYDLGIKIGMKKLVKEMQRDWKRLIRR